MAQNYNNTPNNVPPRSDNSGMGVVLGILLAVVIAIGAYMFMRGDANTNGNIEPAAGVEAPMAGDTVAPAADGTAVPVDSANPAVTTTPDAATAPGTTAQPAR